mmetsp:Transcript_9961/g.25702  ORF Transcript_9961/g.25702 Transcript_9961/m.25702 type:complete len:164 (-) Transcript_9961:51-542(-)
MDSPVRFVGFVRAARTEKAKIDRVPPRLLPALPPPHTGHRSPARHQSPQTLARTAAICAPPLSSLPTLFSPLSHTPLALPCDAVDTRLRRCERPPELCTLRPSLLLPCADASAVRHASCPRGFAVHVGQPHLTPSARAHGMLRARGAHGRLTARRAHGRLDSS